MFTVELYGPKLHDKNIVSNILKKKFGILVTLLNPDTEVKFVLHKKEAEDLIQCLRTALIEAERLGMEIP